MPCTYLEPENNAIEFVHAHLQAQAVEPYTRSYHIV